MRTSAPCAILRVKSPPRLEPRDIQRLLEHNFAAKRRENASAPQNGISSQTQQGIPPQGFQNHIPARGRKRPHSNNGTSRDPQFQNHIPARGRKPFATRTIVLKLFISKPYPRKGTETNHLSSLVLSPFYFKTISPQGDGNASTKVRTSFPEKFQNHIPARGRKP